MLLNEPADHVKNPLFRLLHCPTIRRRTERLNKKKKATANFSAVAFQKMRTDGTCYPYPSFSVPPVVGTSGLLGNASRASHIAPPPPFVCLFVCFNPRPLSRERQLFQSLNKTYIDLFSEKAQAEKIKLYLRGGNIRDLNRCR
jgi:hypothetical protein